MIINTSEHFFIKRWYHCKLRKVTCTYHWCYVYAMGYSYLFKSFVIRLMTKWLYKPKLRQIYSHLIYFNHFNHSVFIRIESLFKLEKLLINYRHTNIVYIHINMHIFSIWATNLSYKIYFITKVHNCMFNYINSKEINDLLTG